METHENVPSYKHGNPNNATQKDMNIGLLYSHGKYREDGCTPLCMAARTGQLQMLQLLCDAGACKDKALESPVKKTRMERHRRPKKKAMTEEALETGTGDQVSGTGQIYRSGYC